MNHFTLEELKCDSSLAGALIVSQLARAAYTAAWRKFSSAGQEIPAAMLMEFRAVKEHLDRNLSINTTGGAATANVPYQPRDADNMVRGAKRRYRRGRKS
jgi:hypothetical protein